MPLPKEKKHTADEYFTYTPEDNSERYELIYGELVALAAPSRIHQTIVGEIFATIRNFIKSNKGDCEPFIAPFDVCIDLYNVVQPDVLVVCDPEKLDDKRCNGAPDLIVEVTSSNRSRDYTDKLILYRRSGVREYWIVNPEENSVLVYCFDKSDFLELYAFTDNIPVGIYNGQLTVNISELLA